MSFVSLLIIFIFLIINKETMKKFYDLLSEYGSQNNVMGTDKETIHSYGPIYERIINGMAKRRNLKILEIGILSGSFVQVLHELFPHAEVYGVDISLKNYKYHHQNKNSKNVHIFEMDGTSKETADYLNECFDLIIEDGSHLPDHQKKTLDAFAPYLKKNGVFVIEDIPQGSDKLKQDLARIGVKHHLTMEWVDLTHVKHRFDDILAIFRH